MPPEFDASEFFALFVQEGSELIQTLDQALVDLEKQPDNAGLIDEVFRAAHSLKASAASQGLEQMSHLAHALENLLDRLRKGERQASPEIFDLLLGGVDGLKSHLQAATAGGAAPDCGEALEALRAAASEEAPEPSRRAPAPGEGDEAEVPADALWLEVALTESCAMPAARAWLVLQQLGAQGEILWAQPSLEELKEGGFEGRTMRVALRSESTVEELTEVALRVPEIAGAREVEPEARRPEPAAQARPAEEGVKPAAAGAGGAEAQQTVRVSVEHIDALMSLVGELVIARTRLSNLEQKLREADAASLPEVTRKYELIVDNLALVITELQERVTRTRMVPVEQVFMRFPRLLRDTARREGKEVQFVTEGGDTELDSSLIENLVDPLKHMLRNAVSHGIELPEQRVAAGKPREGTVRLRACQEGGSIAIEISDDGAGMDPERLRQTAVQKGLRSAAQVAAMSDQQALGLIFLAGFSTAEQVSDVSGRGVGMDVVTSNLEKVSGSVTLRSEMGKGTVVALRLPLTVAIIRGLLVTSTDIIFALPLSAVQRVHRAGREEVSLLQRQPAITLGEQVLPLTSLARACGLLQCEPPLADKTNVVVVTADGRDQGLMVDDILGNEELVIQPLGKALGEVKVLSGVAVLGDGRLALIVDVPTLLRSLRGEAATAALLAA